LWLGIFTTRAHFRAGKAFAYERQLAPPRKKDAALIRLPLLYTAAKIACTCTKSFAPNNVTEGSARIYLVYNQVGFWRSEEAQPQVDLIIYSAPLPEYREPVRLGLREHGRHAAAPLAGVKSISWLPNVWAVAEAQRKGSTKVVLLNERGEVAECTAANIFAVKNGKIYTPPLNSGCLEGVTRGISPKSRRKPESTLWSKIFGLKISTLPRSIYLLNKSQYYWRGRNCRSQNRRRTRPHYSTGGRTVRRSRNRLRHSPPRRRHPLNTPCPTQSQAASRRLKPRN